MRLINASRAIARVEEIPILTDKNQSFYEGCRYMQKRVLRIFHTSKTIDAVEVVRCKDCVYFSHEKIMCNHEGNIILDIGKTAYPNDFCSYGERKDGDGGEV